MRNAFSYVLYLSVLLVALVAGGCAQNPVSGQSEFVLMSESDEIRLGRGYHAKIVKQYGYYEDERLQAYVQRIGERVAARGHRPHLIYRFTVLDSPDVNAFALPGGYIYITRGLLAYLNSEAELAAVLGHEAGHVTARHSVRQYTAQQTANMGITLGSMILPELRSAGDLFNVIGGALLSGYGREHELEADRLGAEYLAKSGYHPQAMIDVIRVLKNQELFEKQRAKAEGRKANVYHGLFASHPDNDTRLKEVIGRANAFMKSSTRTIKRDEFLNKINGMTFGPGTRKGVLRGNKFYHRDLDIGITFPRGWRVKNRTDKLVAQTRNNDAFLQLTVEDLNRHMSPREFIRERLKFETLYEPGSISAGSYREEMPGYTGLVKTKTPFGQQSVRITVIYYRNRAYIFAGVAKNQRKLYQHDPDFLDTARSLHKLTRTELPYTKAQRIKLFRASSRSRYADLARRVPLLNYPTEQLRLLNGDYPRGEPRPGERIKLVE